MSNIHFYCLERWVLSKINKEEDKKIFIILWKQLYCELCKSKLELVYKTPERSFFLFESIFRNSLKYNDSSNKIVILEYFSRDDEPLGLIFLDFSSKTTLNIVKN